MCGCESWTIKWLSTEELVLSNYGVKEVSWVPWTARRSKQSILKEINPEIFVERTDAKAKTPILWPPDAKNWLIGEDPDAGKDWRQEEKGKTEDEMVGWHHWLNGHDFKHTLGDSEGPESLVCVAVHGVTKSWTQLRDLTTKTYCEALKNLCSSIQ